MVVGSDFQSLVGTSRGGCQNLTPFVAARDSPRPSRPLPRSNPKTHARTRRKPGLFHPETCFSHVLKILHFCLNSAVRISGSNLCEKVGNPGIPYVALQLMTGIWGMAGTNTQ